MRMKLRLNRLSNLFRREVKTACLVLGVLFFVLPVLILLAYGALNPLFFLLILGFNLVCFFTILFSFPGSVRLYDGSLSFSEYRDLSGGGRRKIHFTVTEIREVEYVQNAMERKLNIGRVRFRGEAELEPCYNMAQRQSMHFLICGVRKFSEFTKQFDRMTHRSLEPLHPAE